MINDVSSSTNKPNRHYPSNNLVVGSSDYGADYEVYGIDHLNERTPNNSLEVVRTMIATHR